MASLLAGSGAAGPVHSQQARWDSAYEAVDRHALAAPRKAEKSVRSLARYLAQGATSDEQKARAIFRWITAKVDYDTKSYFAGRKVEMSAQQVLQKRLAICDGYATLFSALATEMGLESEIADGYARGYGIKQGYRFDAPNHAWNAVKIDGQWRLIDSTWGAGDVRDDRNFHRRFKPFYFLADPQALLFSHLPVEDRWQLVQRPISKTEFEQRPYVHPVTFAMGFSAQQIMELEANRQQPVVPFEHPGLPIRVVSAPALAELTSGQQYRFSIAAPRVEKLVLVSGEQWIDMNHEGGVYQMEVRPDKGRVDILAKVAGNDDLLVLLRYDVK